MCATLFLPGFKRWVCSEERKAVCEGLNNGARWRTSLSLSLCQQTLDQTSKIPVELMGGLSDCLAPGYTHGKSPTNTPKRCLASFCSWCVFLLFLRISKCFYVSLWVVLTLFVVALYLCSHFKSIVALHLLVVILCLVCFNLVVVLCLFVVILSLFVVTLHLFRVILSLCTCFVIVLPNLVVIVNLFLVALGVFVVFLCFSL